jgi:hypothetical protein
MHNVIKNENHEHETETTRSYEVNDEEMIAFIVKNWKVLPAKSRGWIMFKIYRALVRTRRDYTN